MMQSRSGLLSAVLSVAFALASLGAACGTEEPASNGGAGGATGGSRAGGSGGSGRGGTGGGAMGGSGGGTGGSAMGGAGGGAGGAGAGGAAGDGPSSDGGDAAGGAGEAGSEAGGSGDGGGGDLAAGVSPMTSFFITSRTGGGDLGGIAGADKICQELAAAVGLGGKTWKAYLGVDEPRADPKSRIGTGPWYNVKGTKIADTVDGLHTNAGNMLSGPNGLTEKGVMVPTGNPQQHDIITGANADGTLAAGKTCTNWTGQGVARVGHFNKMGGGQSPMSWNSAHDSQGCTAANLVATGGAGRFYCFATTP